MTQHAGTRFVVFSRELLCINLPRALFIYAQRTVHYGVVIVSRNLERTNQNDGFKMTALENVNNSFVVLTEDEITAFIDDTNLFRRCIKQIMNVPPHCMELPYLFVPLHS